MSRIMGVSSQNAAMSSFPYAPDGVDVPYTDGLIGGGLASNFLMGNPSPTNSDNQINSEAGKVIPGGLKDSNTEYVFATQVHYPIFAGDF